MCEIANSEPRSNRTQLRVICQLEEANPETFLDVTEAGVEHGVKAIQTPL